MEKEKNVLLKKIGRFLRNCGIKIILQIVLFAGLTYGGVRLAEYLLGLSLFEPISILEMIFGESEIFSILGRLLSGLFGFGIVPNVIIIQSSSLFIISILFLSATYKGCKNADRIKGLHITLMSLIILTSLFLLTSGFGAFFGNGRMMFLSWAIPALVFVIGLLEILISVNRFTGINYFLLKIKAKNKNQEDKNE